MIFILVLVFQLVILVRRFELSSFSPNILLASFHLTIFFLTVLVNYNSLHLNLLN